MPFVCRLMIILLLGVGLPRPCTAAAPAPGSCEALLTRLESLSAAMEKTKEKKALARMQAELDKLAGQYGKRCAQSSFGASRREAAQAPYPEDEIKRRRALINQKKRYGNSTSVARAIPLAGSIRIESGASSSLRGKGKQEIAYTIQETFVGNLIVIQNGSREDYVIQTLSTEIDASEFRGRVCAQYRGAPSACAKWHALDMWQIADGEEYPGRSDGVVSAASDSRGVTLKIDGPDIEFSSSHNAAKLRPRCGDQVRLTVSRDQFKQWLRRSSATIKHRLGTSSPGCQPGTTITLELRIGTE